MQIYRWAHAHEGQDVQNWDRRNVIWGGISLTSSSPHRNAVLALLCCFTGSRTKFCSNICCIWPSRQKVSGKTRRLKRISCKSHMCIRSWLKACIFTKRKEKGGVHMEKRGEKSQWRKWEQALLLLAESDTRETTLAKASLLGGIEG